MKICAAQNRPIKGNIEANLANHISLINRGIAMGAQAIIFPELSLTGYEPSLAKKLAVKPSDTRFDIFQRISNASSVMIGVGAPTETPKGTCISMLIFYPQKPRSLYSKTYLHVDEEPFFVRGQNSPQFQAGETTLALAICYEISVPEHLSAAMKAKPGAYVASVAKFANGINTALNRLSDIARLSSLPVIMANCVGISDGKSCAGHTSAWNDQGVLVGQLNDSDEGFLTFDSQTQNVVR